jgi:uncharacterized protein (UPF0261 family)
VEEARRLLAAHGLQSVEYPATGVGGRELEADVARGRVAGVLDITTGELADTLVGGVFSSGPDRLTAAALHGVPQVIVPGCLDRANFAGSAGIAGRFPGRLRLELGGGAVLLRTTQEENDSLGRELALKASAARGPTAVLLPLRGFSALDAVGQPFWWPAADRALVQSVRNWIGPGVVVSEQDLHVNDRHFAREVVVALTNFLGVDTGTA